MKDLSQYNISSEGLLSRLLRAENITDFFQLSEWLQHLPYKRISDPSNLDLVVIEQCGTCSSKHAFFSTVAIENGLDVFKLIVGVYKMNEKNTPGIGDAISAASIEYIPEAHCYIMYRDQVIDVTKPESIYDIIKDDILEEIQMSPAEVISSKKNYHKSYIKRWRISNKIPYDAIEIWEMRERCIQQLIKKS